MKNRLFQFDLISFFAFCTMIILALSINSLIETEFSIQSNEKDKIYSWIRVVSSLLLCIAAISFLRNKRRKAFRVEDEKI